MTTIDEKLIGGSNLVPMCTTNYGEYFQRVTIIANERVGGSNVVPTVVVQEILVNTIDVLV